MKIKDNNFTMIELLIVIAIIVILTGMLLPALQRAKKKTEELVCKKNLGTWGQVVVLYSSDFNGFIPATLTGAPIYTFAGALSEGGYFTRGNSTANLNYLYAGKILCPTGCRLQRTFTLGRYDPYMYGKNNNTGGVYAYIQLSALKNPSATCLLADSVNSVSGQSSGDYYFGCILQRPTGNQYYGEPDFRHVGICNVLYYDFHVSGKTVNSIPYDNYDIFWGYGN